MFRKKWNMAIAAGLFGMALFAGAGNVVAHEEHEAQAVNVQAGTEAETCAVTGEEIDKKAAITYEYEGKIYYLCCADCLEKFKKDPERYVQEDPEAPSSHEDHSHE